MSQSARLRLAEFNHAEAGPAERRIKTKNYSVLGVVVNWRGANDWGRDSWLSAADARCHLMELLERNAHARHCASDCRAAKGQNGQPAAQFLSASRNKPSSIESA